jgi:hypothetical protein
MTVWVRKDDVPGIMPWNLRYEPVVKQEECTCWDGYERVPGTAPCESGSCREIKKHGDHDQKDHGRWASGSASSDAASRETVAPSSVWQKILAKPEDQRGISVNIIGEEPVDGFMVSFVGAWNPVAENDFVRDGKSIIRDYLKTHRDALGSSNKTYMGIWFNTGTRQYEFDLSEQVPTKSKAIEIGQARQLEAAWDVKREELVPIGARDPARQEQIDTLP